MSKMKKIKFLSDIEIAGTMTVGESKAEILTKDDLATPDWNQNDENASDYVKNRTHYEEPAINKEYVILDKSYSFEEEQQEGYGGTGYFKYPLVKDWSEIITIGSKLTVTIDGEIHEAIFEGYYHGFRLPGLLAGTGYDNPDDYPILYFDADGITLHFGYNAGGWSMDIGPLTISTNEEAIVHQLDEKFIPETISRTQKVDEKIAQSFTSHEPTELIRTSNNSDHSNYVVGSKRQSSDKILYGLHSSNYPEYFPFWDNHNVGSTFLLEIIKDSNIIFSEKLIWHKELSYEHTDESVLGNFALTSTYSEFGDTEELATIYINDADSFIGLYLDEGLLKIDDVVTAKLYYCEEKINTIDDITVNTTQLNNILSNIDNHEYGDYIIAFEPSCTGKGKRYQVCSCCGNKRIEYIPSQGHNEVATDEIPISQLSYGYTSKVYCNKCGLNLYGGEVIDNAGLYETGTNNRTMTIDELISADEVSGAAESHIVHQNGYFGSSRMSYGYYGELLGDIVIPEDCMYLYDPNYGGGGLACYSSITGVVIPASCIDIGYNTFWHDTSLTRITYKGTIAQWKAITKGDDWYPCDEEGNPTNYTIYCTNGTITHDGSAKIDYSKPGLYDEDGNITSFDSLVSDGTLVIDKDSNAVYATDTSISGTLVIPEGKISQIGQMEG